MTEPRIVQPRAPGADFDQAVGALVREAADLERAVASTLWGVVGVPEDLGRIALGNSMSRMLKTIRQVLELREVPDTLQSEFAAWAGQVMALWSRRDVVVHSTWTEDPAVGEGVFVRNDLRPVRVSADQITTAEVFDIARRIDAQHRVWHRDLLDALVDAYPGPHWMVVNGPEDLPAAAVHWTARPSMRERIIGEAGERIDRRGDGDA